MSDLLWPTILPPPQGKLCWVLQCIAAMLGLRRTLHRFANAPTMDDQLAIWNSNPVVRFIKHGPAVLVYIVRKIVAFLLFNRFVLW